jgi:SAM-dependent methyltransferase
METYQLIATQSVCPICYSKTGRILWSVTSAQATQHYVLKEADTQRFLELSAHIRGLWGKDTCDIVQCDDCGFCYSHPYVAGDQQFYTLAYERDHYPGWKWEYQLTYEALKDKRNFTLLEIGAGDGAFIKRIVPELTDNDKAVCTEFSDYGKSQIQSYGVKCLPADIRSITAEDLIGAVDVVCMFQVLEHMDRLDELFQHLNGLTKDEANLFISVRLLSSFRSWGRSSDI